MRNIPPEIFDPLVLSDPNPVRRAQIQMKTQLPKRFYKAVAVGEIEGGYTVLLDGRPALTPMRAPLALPTKSAGTLVASEFEAQAATIDPVTMPVLRLVNTAIDGVAKEVDAVLEDIQRFASSDMLCYRASTPEALIQRENDVWDPVLDWARDAIGARMILAEGIVFVAQPPASIAAVGIHLRRRADAFRLACMHLMTSLTGSALLAIAVEAGALEAEAAWAAAHVDEDFQAEQWGQDHEAMVRRTMRKRDFDAAFDLLEALDTAG